MKARYNISLLLGIQLFAHIHSFSQPIQFTSHTIYQASSRIFFTSAADLDNDGDQDVLYTQPNQELLQWYENQGEGDFLIREVGNFPEAFSVWVIDFDDDGDNDLFASSYDPAQVVYFENDGQQVFSYHLISTEIPHPLTIAAGDIDGDGDDDIACATQDANKGMMLLRNDGNLVFTPMDLSSQPYSSTWVILEDLDRDGDIDVLGNNFHNNGGVLWYEQTSPLVFTEHLVPFPGTHGFTAADLDGDDDTDLAAVACGVQVAWFENDGLNNFTSHLLDENFDCAVSITAADLDLDQKMDLVASAWSANQIAWWQNENGHSFTKYLVSDSLLRPNCVHVADFNNDGLPDIVSGGYSGKLMWLENTGHGVGGITPNKDGFAQVGFQPETQTLEIRLNSNINHATASIFRIDGKVLKSENVSSIPKRIDCTNWAPGIYFVRLASGERSSSHKFSVYR